MNSTPSWYHALQFYRKWGFFGWYLEICNYILYIMVHIKIRWLKDILSTSTWNMKKKLSIIIRFMSNLQGCFTHVMLKLAITLFYIKCIFRCRDTHKHWCINVGKHWNCVISVKRRICETWFISIEKRLIELFMQIIRGLMTSIGMMNESILVDALTDCIKAYSGNALKFIHSSTF